MNGRQRQISKPIKQHWTPRFYIKEFSTTETRDTRDPQVWIFSRNEGDPQKVNIKDVAAKRYLYSPKNEEGVRCWRIEDKLAALESTIGMFWSCIARDFVNLDEVWVRKGVSLFMATLMLRHPNKMDEYRGLRAQLTSFFDSFPKDASGRPIIRYLETKHEALKFDTSNWFKYRNPTEYDRHKLFVDQISYSALDVAKLLMEKRWSVIFSDEPCFITTDRPVTVFNQEKERFGLATKGTIISFPLSPTRVLVLDDRFNEPHSQFYPLAEHGPGPINIAHWAHAYNFMISHRHPDDVDYEMVNLCR